MYRSPAIQALLDRLAAEAGIGAEERAVLEAGGSHPFLCRCETCRLWWRSCGPDEDGRFGPFTREEVESDVPL